MNLPPLQFSFIPVPLIPGVVSKGIIFALHICVHIFAPYSPSYRISLSSPTLTVALPAGQNLFFHLVL
jgi:hypothetical protein